VLVLQAVRFFRDNRNDRDRDHDGEPH
jgi:hypothetical protein